MVGMYECPIWYLSVECGENPSVSGPGASAEQRGGSFFSGPPGGRDEGEEQTGISWGEQRTDERVVSVILSRWVENNNYTEGWTEGVRATIEASKSINWHPKLASIIVNALSFLMQLEEWPQMHTIQYSVTLHAYQPSHIQILTR